MLCHRLVLGHRSYTCSCSVTTFALATYPCLTQSRDLYDAPHTAYASRAAHCQHQYPYRMVRKHPRRPVGHTTPLDNSPASAIEAKRVLAPHTCTAFNQARLERRVILSSNISTAAIQPRDPCCPRAEKLINYQVPPVTAAW